MNGTELLVGFGEGVTVNCEVLQLSTTKSWMGYQVDVSRTISLLNMLDAIHQIRQVPHVDKAKTIVPIPGIDEITDRGAQKLATYVDSQMKQI